MKKFEQLELNDCVLSSESRQSQTPRGTRLTAHRSIGAALHTLDHQFSKSRYIQKLRSQTIMLTRLSDLSQGRLALEDTAPGTTPSSRGTRP